MNKKIKYSGNVSSKLVSFFGGSHSVNSALIENEKKNYTDCKPTISKAPYLKFASLILAILTCLSFFIGLTSNIKVMFSFCISLFILNLLLNGVFVLFKDSLNENLLKTRYGEAQSRLNWAYSILILCIATIGLILAIVMISDFIPAFHLNGLKQDIVANVNRVFVEGSNDSLIALSFISIISFIFIFKSNFAVPTLISGQLTVMSVYYFTIPHFILDDIYSAYFHKSFICYIPIIIAVALNIFIFLYLYLISNLAERRSK